jgi:hypothetical protein
VKNLHALFERAFDFIRCGRGFALPFSSPSKPHPCNPRPSSRRDPLSRYLFVSSLLFLFPLPQRTTTMRRTVKGGKAATKKSSSSSGAQFYGPDR